VNVDGKIEKNTNFSTKPLFHHYTELQAGKSIVVTTYFFGLDPDLWAKNKGA